MRGETRHVFPEDEPERKKDLHPLLQRRLGPSTKPCLNHCKWQCYSPNFLIESVKNISALVGCIQKLRALYKVQLLETFQIQKLNLH